MNKIELAPRDGTSVLLKFKNEEYLKNVGKIDYDLWSEKFCVMCWVNKNFKWCFNVPVGVGGFTDNYFEGFWFLNEYKNTL